MAYKKTKKINSAKACAIFMVTLHIFLNIQNLTVFRFLSNFINVITLLLHKRHFIFFVHKTIKNVKQIGSTLVLL